MTATKIHILAARIFRVPMSIYDISAQDYRASELYIQVPKSATGSWIDVMMDAQKSCVRPATSSEWYRGRQWFEQNHGEYERDFIEGPSEWTGTVLDFESGELLEGIELNADMPRDEARENPRAAIKAVRTRLGRNNDIILPQESAYITDLATEYMPLVAHLWGVQDPKRELPDNTFLRVSPGFRPVVRGGWYWDPRANGRVYAAADYDAALRRFAARLVSETRPENALTPEQYAEQYEALMRELSGKPVLVE